MGELEARKVALSDVFAVKKRNRFLQRTWEKTDFIYVAFMVFMHGLALAAPFTFSWGNLALFCVTYAITGKQIRSFNPASHTRALTHHRCFSPTILFSVCISEPATSRVTPSPAAVSQAAWASRSATTGS